ncbi:DNA topology modulation protein FlaR [Piscibacillus halophilus]|uniref:DNA topology modulation protein FlaR n=1 Tax=Piscibacillus halophilus TaxID=571933 RepID=UPI001FE9FB9F|nr:DNA topology modulation protein FlaR [Piscibacillus halophilus]
MDQVQMKPIYKKIHIIGSVGSGKTTLAKYLSERYNIPYYELDNVVWERHPSGDIRRDEKSRQNYINSIVNSKHWIIEGAYTEKWVSNSFEQADIIIFLNPKYSVRVYRIIQRFIKQKLRLEKSNYQPTFRIFIKMFKWNRYFDQVGKPDFFKKYNYVQNKNKVVVINNSKE